MNKVFVEVEEVGQITRKRAIRSFNCAEDTNLYINWNANNQFLQSPKMR